MTKDTQSPRYVSLSPSAGSTTLAYDFVLTQADGLVVTRTRAGMKTTLDMGEDYSFPDGLGTDSGGTLTLVAPTLEGDTFLLVGKLPELRVSDFVATQEFRSAKFNADLDALTLMAQEHRRDIDRSWKAAYGEAGGEIIVGAADEVIVGDGAGNLVPGPSVAVLEGYSTAAQEAAEAATSMAGDASASAARAEAAAVGVESIVRPEQYGAVGAGDDTVGIDNMMLAAKSGDQIYLSKSYKVTTFRNYRGNTFYGPGEIVKAAAAGSPGLQAGLVRLNFGRDKDRDVVGEEYLYALRRRFSGLAPTTPSRKNIVGFIYGDSTFATPSGVLSDFRNYPEYAFSLISPEIGLPGTFFLTNLAKAGTTLEDCVSGNSKDGSTPVSNLAAGVDLSVFKFGLNEANDATLADRPGSLFTAAAYHSSVLRAAFAAIRADANGKVDTHTIIYFGPNAANNTNYQDIRWLEVFIPLIKQACRDYQVCYIDTFYRWPDAYNSSYRWTDGRWTTPGGATPSYGPLHPNDIGWATIWSAVRELFRSSLLTRQNRTSAFLNLPKEMAALPFSALPSAYEMGLSQHRVTTAEGWISPFTGAAVAGLVVTHKSGNGDLTSQTLHIDGTNQITIRRKLTASDAWTEFSGGYSAPALLNSWVNFGSGTTEAGYSIGIDGVRRLRGLIKSGAITIGTTLFTLPTALRPSAITRLLAAAAGSGTVVLAVQTNGNVNLDAISATASPSVWTSLDGLTF